MLAGVRTRVKTAGGEDGAQGWGFVICGRGGTGHFLSMADETGHFMRIEREDAQGVARHYVVHLRDPKFSLEMTPDVEAPDKIGAGVLKRVVVPNSWAGNYGQYAALLKAAQEFFRQSLVAEPVEKGVTRRLGL